ncbi:MAG: transcriptional repressor LexA [Planctomycetes bacterium]|nr:transcriptional repressor LexA [Planctomycetota bacterium]
MKELTAAQQRVLDFIRRFLDQHGHPPSQAEIARALGYRSANAAAQHLRLLEKKGVLRIRPGVSRGLCLEAGAGTEPGLPLIGEVAAGSPILAEENVEKQLQLPAGLFRPRPDYLLRVRGDSMIEAGIRGGDLVAVHRAGKAEDGRIAVVRLGEDVTLKVWRRRGSRIVLEPRNPAHQEIVVDPRRQPITLEGLVVGLLRLDMRI